jgi:hypothetical protein
MAMPAILRLLRPGDWTKGVFVLVPIVFWLAGEGRTVDASIAQAKVRAAFMAFVAIGLVASGWYALNDAWDAPEDRLHPTKRRRPVASGAVRAYEQVNRASGRQGETRKWVRDVTGARGGAGLMTILRRQTIRSGRCPLIVRLSGRAHRWRLAPRSMRQ